MKITDYEEVYDLHDLDVVLIDGDRGTKKIKVSKIASSDLDSEAWAVGTMDGVPVSDVASQYHNNSKYYAERTGQYVDTAVSSAEAAVNASIVCGSAMRIAGVSRDEAVNASIVCGSAMRIAGVSRDEAVSAAGTAVSDAHKSEGHAVGTEDGSPVGPSSPYYNNNAKYWSEVAQSAAVGGITPKGTCTFATLPSTSEADVGDMWNISDNFVTTSDFREGAGHKHKAGTNVYFTSDDKWDVYEGEQVDPYPIIAQVENTQYATRAYDKGEQFIKDERLFVVKRQIDIGESLRLVGDSNYTGDFVKKKWYGITKFSNGNDFWTDGENIYYSKSSNHYVLDKSTGTWSTKTWNSLTNFNGQYIWTDGNNIYYSNGSTQYVLNKSTDTWNPKTWSGLTSFVGYNIWTDGENIYYSYNANQYVLDKSTSTWSAKTWNGLTSFIGNLGIWTDGENIYYSYDTDQYVLDKSTSTWNPKTWNGLTSFIGSFIWTDGENIYYSNGSAQYVLDKSTSTWNSKTWSGLTSFSASGIWTDGENTYLSYTTTTASTSDTNAYNFVLNLDNSNIELADQTIINQISDKPDDCILDGRNLEIVFASEIQSKYTDVWDWIQGRLNSGKLNDLRVGDYIRITLSNGETQDMLIAGINTYKGMRISGTTSIEIKNHIDWISRDTYGYDYIPWRSSQGSNNGTATYQNPFMSSSLYAWLNNGSNGLLSMLPTEVRNVIKEKRLWIPKRYSASETVSKDNGWLEGAFSNLWLPFEIEVFGHVIWSTPGYGSCGMVQYDLFKKGYDSIITYHGDRRYTDEKCSWHLASAETDSTALVMYVAVNGVPDTSGVTGKRGVRICFRTMADY